MVAEYILIRLSALLPGCGIHPPHTHTLTHKHIAVCLSSFIRFKLRYQAEIKVKANKNGERHL